MLRPFRSSRPWPQMGRPSLLRAIALSSFMMVTLACWIVAGLVADNMAERELDDAIVTQRRISAAAADNMAQMIASDLAMARAIPETIAEIRMIQRALAQAQNYAAKRPGMEPELRGALSKAPRAAPRSRRLGRLTRLARRNPFPRGSPAHPLKTAIRSACGNGKVSSTFIRKSSIEPRRCG
ncbi:hypothetical protein [Trinickia mobilis]|uniref:hypothetical protein n=1 Tax=Trinickia mobilis TaxID=2816356 RepID=UPI001A8CE79A|nr:hypothetical protein [Trinickia mobilis]